MKLLTLEGYSIVGQIYKAENVGCWLKQQYLYVAKHGMVCYTSKIHFKFRSLATLQNYHLEFPRIHKTYVQ